MFLCVSLIMLALVLGDMWFHATGKWQTGTGLPPGATGIIQNLQAELGARSNELAQLQQSLRALQVGQEAARAATPGRLKAETDELRESLKDCQHRLDAVNKKLDARAREAEKLRAAERAKQETIRKLKQRIARLEREREQNRAEKATSTPDEEPTPIVVPENAVKEPPTSIPPEPPAKIPPTVTGTNEAAAVSPVEKTGEHASATSVSSGKRNLSQPGWPGMWRGAARVMCAPLLVPYGVFSGVAGPWQADPELGGGTNKALHAASSGAVMPLSMTVGGVAGAGGCFCDTMRGVADLCSFGYYGMREEAFEDVPDARPYILQLVDKDLPPVTAVIEDEHTTPNPAREAAQKRMVFPEE